MDNVGRKVKKSASILGFVANAGINKLKFGLGKSIGIKMANYNACEKCGLSLHSDEIMCPVCNIEVN